MRGPRPEPTHLKIVKGNPGRRPLNKNEPRPTGNLFDPPDYLTDDQKAGWTYAIANAPPGLLRRLDRSTLVVWVVAEDLHRQAAKKLATFGLLVKGKDEGAQPYQSPYLSILNRQAQIMLRSAEQLGFTPSSRTRIEIDPAGAEDPGEADDFAEFG